MAVNRFGPNFPRLFAAALFQELSFSLLIHAPGYFSALGASEGKIGLLYSACALVSLLFRPLLGRILDLTHRRTVILFAASGNIIVLFLLSLTSAWGPVLWGLFLFQRTMQLALFTTILTYGADSIPLERRTQGLAIFGLSGLIPIAVGGYAGDVLIDVVGFSGLFIAAAISSIVSWLVVWVLPVLPVRGREPRRSFWAAFAQRSLLPIWFVALLLTIGMEAIFTFTRTFVEDRQVGTTGLFFGVYGLVAASTRILGGDLYNRVPHRPLLTGSIAAFGVGLGLMAVAQSVPVLLAASVVMATAHGAAFPLLSSEVVNRARVSERGSAMSIFTALFDVALLAAAPAVGFMIDGFSYLVAFSVTGVVLFVGAFVYRVWDRTLDPSALVAEEVLE